MVVVLWALALAAEPVAAPAEADALVRALSMRHAVPCTDLEAGLSAPVEALRWAVAEVQQPPWAAMRAAECLTRGHAAAVQSDLIRWVEDPALMGLGRQTLGLLSVLDVEVAMPVARAALNGHLADRARQAVSADPRPELRALEVKP